MNLFRLFKRKPSHWVSFYRDPRGNSIYPERYLARDYHGEGWVYILSLDKAHKFATKEEALAVTPSYDGSSGIENRAGVIEVR